MPQPWVIYERDDIAYLVTIKVELCQVGEVGQRRDITYPGAMKAESPQIGEVSKIRELYPQETREEAARLLVLIILNLRAEDDGGLIRWGNTLRRWREPIMNYFDGTTNGFTEGCNTKIKMLKRVSYGLRNIDVYWRKMLL